MTPANSQHSCLRATGLKYSIFGKIVPEVQAEAHPKFYAVWVKSVRESDKVTNK